MNTNTETESAIIRSTSHNEIVTLEWSSDHETELLCACDDFAQTTNGQCEVHEFWGRDEDGEWRVHLQRRTDSVEA